MGNRVGRRVGLNVNVGSRFGLPVGLAVGLLIGCCVVLGLLVGVRVVVSLGGEVGFLVGSKTGWEVSAAEGSGSREGASVVDSLEVVVAGRDLATSNVSLQTISRNSDWMESASSSSLAPYMFI